jgi:hypothetical protein
MHCSPIIVAAALLSLSGCDVTRTRYGTLDDARRDRLFERGWVPDILPASARDIHVSSDLDANRSQGDFSFDPADFATFTSYLHVRDEKTFEYSAGGHTWVFSCDSSRGHCRYSMQ